MYSSKQLTNVALFPLCDVGGVLMDALGDTSSAPGTRADALLFAWRLNLPKGMDIAQAADAVLATANSIRRKAWNEQQWMIVRELELLVAGDQAQPNVKRASKQPKESKEWWRLVGRDALDPNSAQRKTRKRRVSPERKP